jgi:hypothetical protein
MGKTCTSIKVSLPRMTAPMGGARKDAALLWDRMVKLHRWGRKRNVWLPGSRFKTISKAVPPCTSKPCKGSRGKI